MKNRVAFYMKELDRGPSWIADKIGVHYTTVMNWRDDEDIIPSKENIKQLCKVFQCFHGELIIIE